MKIMNQLRALRSMTLSVVAVAALSLSMSACGDENNDDGPSFDNTKTFSINDATYPVKSVGYYFNDTYGNFKLMFTSTEMDLSRQLTSEPTSPYLIINIPQEKCGMSLDLTQSLNSSYAIFYVQTSDGAFADFAKGRIYISVNGSKVKAHLSGTAEKGPELSLYYEGSAQRSDKQIW